MPGGYSLHWNPSNRKRRQFFPPLKGRVSLPSWDEGDYTKPYSFLLGCPVHSAENIPPSLVAVTVPGGSYAKFCAQGEYPQSVVTAWGNIWQQHSLQRAYTCDFEVYTKGFFSGVSHEVDIFVAVT